MTTRQVLLLGGAALVLAACADSTAPGTQMRNVGVRAAFTEVTSTTDTTATDMDVGDCRGGYTVAAGGKDSTCSDDTSLDY